MKEIRGERMKRERRKIEQWIDVLGKEEDLGKRKEIMERRRFRNGKNNRENKGY